LQINKNSILHWIQRVIHVHDSYQLLHTVFLWQRYLPIISRTVSGLNGDHVPFDSATCNSSPEIYPLLSLSTLEQIKNQPHQSSPALENSLLVTLWQITIITSQQRSFLLFLKYTYINRWCTNPGRQLTAEILYGGI
jgi:hypothetical protein